MKSDRPHVDDAEIYAFIHQNGMQHSEPPQVSQVSAHNNESKATKLVDTILNADERFTSYASSTSREHKPIVKFLLEMPAELRRAIKFRSIDNEISMNDLIVACLQERFGV
ncbi:hypothetical protein OR1_03648 [Geobacter sp. OR-1]|uniref:hypothetical protein n=1 Tax=Geobacter sp. OR-1 TaxID=1266765 RepID=UPI000543B02D|nr:hypothetical protein [Geobacter sp. OR-1]GAM11335.1 hypothetical protein OR1_03648 [Geobacter sp. OR-1]